MGRLKPRKDETTTRSEFDELFKVFDSVSTSAAPVTPPIQIIVPPKSVIEKSAKLLGKVPQKPTLTLREQELLQTLGINVLSNAKGFLSAKSHEICLQKSPPQPHLHAI